MLNLNNPVKKFCDSPWTTINIGTNGDVYPCTCSIWTDLKLGNVLEQSLTSIYEKSENLKLLRSGVLDGTFSSCIESTCSILHALPLVYYTDPFREFNINPEVKLPTDLVLAIDPNCNLKCPSCRLTNIFSPRPNAITEQILDVLYHDYKNYDSTVKVMLDGAGDVFVSAAYHNFLFNKLPECWKLTILTNGNLLLKKQNEIKSIAAQIDMITVSLDAGTEETYAITRGGDFNNVINGIKMIRDMNIQVHIQFVLQQANYRELLIYKNIAKSLDVSSYGVQKINRWEHMSEDLWNKTKLENNPNINYNLLREHLDELNADPKCILDGGIRWFMRQIY